MTKIKERKYVSVDTEKCSGCRVCEFACSITKENVFNPAKSRIRVVRINQKLNGAVACRFCEDPKCVASCPQKALTQSELNGEIIVDTNKCDGCGWCIQACEYGAMIMHPNKKTVFCCDLCKDQDHPQCIKWCPEEALAIVMADKDK